MKFAFNELVLSQAKAPLLETLAKLAKQTHSAFYTPGHKRGQGIADNLANLLGKAVFNADLPELPQLDNLFAPESVIREAQNLASETYQAQKTWFLVNGSTCGIIAAILATCQSGDKIILPRNIHQSVISGLILAGAIPIFINPIYNSDWDLTYSITPENLQTTLQQHPDSKAVMIVYPTYHGICGDLEKIRKVTDSHNIPLLVDEAHGAHFNFHPQLPPSALSLGADLTVQSTHKVLGALTQASMLHIQGKSIAPQRLHQALSLLQTTSPSYLLLASLDAARQQMALQGKQLLSKTLDLATTARNALTQIPNLSVLTLEKPLPGFRYLDLTRLTVNVSQLGISGYEIDEILSQKFGVIPELPMLHNITFIITFGNTEADIEKLIAALKTIAVSCSHASPLLSSQMAFSVPTLVLSPRDAFFAEKNTIPFTESAGFVSGELICPYPPGIPVLMPGERITHEAIIYLQEVLALGGVISGCSDSRLQTIQIIV